MNILSFFNTPSKNDVDKFHIAVSLRRPKDVAKMLSRYKERIVNQPQDYFNHIPIMSAIEEKSAPITNLLIENGADLFASTSNNENVLMIATKHDNLNVVEKIMASNSAHQAATQQTIDNFDRLTALHYNAFADIDNPDITRALLPKSDLNARSSHGDTALIAAASAKNLGVAQAIVNYVKSHPFLTVDFNARNDEGNTALTHAIFYNSNNEPKHIANRSDLVQLLVNDGGADIYAKNSEGNSPLDFARELPLNDSVRSFIESVHTKIQNTQELQQENSPQQISPSMENIIDSMASNTAIKTAGSLKLKQKNSGLQVSTH